MRTAIGSLAFVFACHVLAYSSARASDPLIERFLAGTEPPLASYRAFRTLEAETRGGQMRGRLTAWTSLDPVLGFQYSIVDEDGSGVVRDKVLRAALEAERAMRARGEVSRGALTASNYEFTGRESADGLMRVDIHPKRHDTMLVEGTILLTEPAGELVRIEGFLVKKPSFWTREVRVARHYAKIAGVRVPVSMQSTARVLFVGISTFSMRYEYTAINAVPVPSPTAPAHDVQSLSGRGLQSNLWGGSAEAARRTSTGGR